MRPALLALALGLAACGPKVNVEPSPYEEDDPRAGAAEAPAEPTWAELPTAPPAPGAREGTVDRAALLPTLDAGPPALLRHLEVAAELDGQRFLGWRLVAIDPSFTRFEGVDLQPGDVLVAVNGQSVARPDQLQSVWDGLRSADAIVADLRRGDGKLQLRWTITGAPAPAPAKPR